MPDILDHAKDVEMRQRQAALDKALKQNEPDQEMRNGIVICISCATPIKAARLSAKPNAARCMHCQQLEERKHGG